MLEVLFQGGQWARPWTDFNSDSPHEQKDEHSGVRSVENPQGAGGAEGLGIATEELELVLDDMLELELDDVVELELEDMLELELEVVLEDGARIVVKRVQGAEHVFFGHSVHEA